MNTNITIPQAQPDWLTLTTAAKHDPQELLAVARDLAAMEKAVGNFPKPFRWRNYEGESVRALSWALGPQGALVQLIGQAAALWIDNLAPHVDRCSRIDFQVTVRFAERTEGVAARGYADALADQDAKGFSAKLRLIESSDGGSTFYYGSPSSDCLARIYDKDREAAGLLLPGQRNDYCNCWRYEVQYRSDLADAAFRSYLSADNRASYCQAVVRNYFAKRGISVPW